MGTRSWLMLVAVGVLLLLALDSFYIVNETEKAVLKRFARVHAAHAGSQPAPQQLAGHRYHDDG